ncbi:hypothetical protein [Desulfonema magnum]|uniref:Uncharacterized protein n=1 Tax=Desulfonema magnum TaxID=45655 RepID=A0A975BGX7_9BACT|nr:hypothetical protein [Desulfonema magnum]QTA85176.1 Uncharacterized protein dnm_011810 [Desulfonema magnum]
MKQLKIMIVLIAFLALALVVPYVANAQDCTAQINTGVWYHWTSYKGGKLYNTGAFKFTGTYEQGGDELRVIQYGDKDKETRYLRGKHGRNWFAIYNPKSGERWETSKTSCKGKVMTGAIWVNGKVKYTFTLDTGRTR